MAVPQIDVARARTFVRAHGRAVDVARLEGLFGRTAPDPAVVQGLEQLQNPDGGFPRGLAVGGFPLTALGSGLGATGGTGADVPRSDGPAGGPAADAAGARAEGPSSVAATCAVLAWLRDIPPLAGSPMASRAVSYLRRQQRVDGAWAEGACARTASPGPGAAGPGDEPTACDVEEAPLPSLGITAMAAYTLLVMDPAHEDPIARAARWLRDALAGGAEGETAGPAAADAAVTTAGAATLALAAAVWRRVHVAGVPDRVWVYSPGAGRDASAGELCAVLTPLAELGLRAGDFLVALRCLEALAGMQQGEGGWPAEDGRAVAATLDALRVFRAFGLA